MAGSTEGGKRQDIRITAPVKWDAFASVPVKDAMPSIHDHAIKASTRARDWYWKSIADKRSWSLLLRGGSYVLLVAGVVLPIGAGLSNDVQTRLVCTQCGVAALAIAGLLQAGDRIFGWSSGWLRYITTVTEMERATQQFELDWSDYMLRKTTPLEDADKLALFALAKRLEEEIARLQASETEKWVAEFNSGLALLTDLIRSQRESAEKAAESARAQVTARAAAIEAEAAAKKPGGIRLRIVHGAAEEPLKVRLDEGPEETLLGTAHAWSGVAPGIHEIRATTVAQPVRTFKMVVEVKAGAIIDHELKLA